MIRKINIAAILVVLILFSGNKLKAQNDTLVLTLDEVINIAHAQSPDALIAKHRFRSSYWKYRSFKAEYLPQVVVDATIPNFAREFRKITVPDGPDVFQYNSTANMNVNLTVEQQIGFTGGSVFVSSNLERLDNFYSDSTLTQWYSVPVIIGYNQPLFNYNEHRWDKKIEPIKYEQAKRAYLEDSEQISITAVNHFFNLLLAQVEKDIAVKNMFNYDTLFKIAQGRFNLGKIAENELLQLELNYLQAQSSVDLANLNYENMLFQLKSYLRIPESGEIMLNPPTNTIHKDISAAKAIAEATKNTSVSLEFDERLLSAESGVRRAKKERFDANLYLQYGLTQSAYTASEAYQDPRDNQVARLGISVPIVDWGVTKGQIKMAESNQELEVTSIEQEIIDFEQSIFLKIMQFNMQEDQIRIAAKSDTVAQKRFDITQKRYLIGLVNDVLELNNAQIDNDNAKSRYYHTLRSYWRNYYEIRQLTLYDFFEEKLLIFDIREIM